MLKRVQNFECPSLPLSDHCELFPLMATNVLRMRIIPTEIVNAKGLHIVEFFFVCFYSAGAEIPFWNSQIYHKS